MSDGAEVGLTIDELARRTGMTVRNVRAHQSRGLLPPPAVRGRTGYYGAEHEDRLELVKELQGEGFNLESIRRLLESAGGSSSEVLRFTRALREPFAVEDEEVEVVDAEELARRFGDADPALLERAIKLGLYRPLGDGRFEQRSPRLAHAGGELTRLGIPLEKTLATTERLRRHAEGAARTFVDLFLETVWRPFEEDGRPEERWPEVLDALERLRPLAAESLLAMFQLVMAERVDQAFGREMERAVRRGRKRSSSRGKRSAG